jgi:hypothetical protein
MISVFVKLHNEGHVSVLMAAVVLMLCNKILSICGSSFVLTGIKLTLSAYQTEIILR